MKVNISNYDKIDNLFLTETYITQQVSSQKYFILKDFNTTLSPGLNSFKIDIVPNVFQLNSQIKIQILDSRNNTIYLYYHPVQIDSSRLVTIVVDNKVSHGSAILTILGKLKKQLVPQK